MIDELNCDQVLSSEDYIEGVYVRYRALVGTPANKYQLVTVLNAGATSYTVTYLSKYTNYEFFLVPFFKSVLGQPSNLKTVQTLEDGLSIYFSLCLLYIYILTYSTTQTQVHTCILFISFALKFL